MTVPVKTDGAFTSLVNPDYTFTLHESSAEEVQVFIDKQESADLVNLFKKAIDESVAIRMSYANRISAAMTKLIS